MGSWIHVPCNCLTGGGQAHRFEGSILGADTSVHRWLNTSLDLITPKLGRLEKLWSVNEIVVEHRVHAFGWYLIVTKFDVGGLVLIVHRLETTKVLHNFLTIGVLSRSPLIIVPIELILSWLKAGVWFVTIGLEARVANDIIQHI